MGALHLGTYRWLMSSHIHLLEIINSVGLSSWTWPIRWVVINMHQHLDSYKCKNSIPKVEAFNLDWSWTVHFTLSLTQTSTLYLLFRQLSGSVFICWNFASPKDENYDIPNSFLQINNQINSMLRNLSSHTQALIIYMYTIYKTRPRIKGTCDCVRSPKEIW